ncbi:MAG TPA: EAL domain-containing protein [Gammaproteobacteria bacterium]|nr:EAL domain-containing protein [Gammaproteobacteria bacterium]
MNSIRGCLRVLLVAPADGEAERLTEILRAAWNKVEIHCVVTLEAFSAGLREDPHVAVAAFDVPAFDVAGALAMWRSHDPDAPFIMMNGIASPAEVAAFMRLGASDFINRVDGHRLVSTIERELQHGRTRREHRKLHELLRLIWTSTPECLKLVAADGTLLDMNPAGLAMLGASDASQVHGKDVLHFIAPKYREPFLALHARVLQGGSGSIQFQVLRLDGQKRWLESRIVPLRDTHGKITSVLAVTRDITERREAEEALAREAQHVAEQAALLDLASDAIVMTDMEDRILLWNLGAAALYGWPAAECHGRKLSELLESELPDQRENVLGALLRDGRWHGEIVQKARNGRRLIVESRWTLRRGADGKASGILQIGTDVTERREAERRLAWITRHDALTGLPNRVLFRERLAAALDGARADDGGVGLFILKLQGLKHINDTLGHHTGDAALQAIAEALRATLEGTGFLARLSGDEFAGFVAGSGSTLPVVADKLLHAVAAPIIVGGHEIFFSANIGCAHFPSDTRDLDEFVRFADIAMHQAKEEGPNSYRLFRPEMNAAIERRRRIEVRLRHALEHDELMLVFQPILRTADRRLIGGEALLRWSNPELGAVSPATFIPLAEQTGLIVPIGAWVLREACRIARDWPDGKSAAPRISVNLSARQLREPGFIDMVQRTLDETGLAPDRLELEITESTLMENDGDTMTRLYDLAGMGIRLAIDDFGIGYSNLARLQRFPVHKLKIDQSFVRECTSDHDAAVIVMTIIRMAQSLGMTTVAEGVETEEQLVFLETASCEEVQGYFLGRPMPEDAFARLVAKGHGAR